MTVLFGLLVTCGFKQVSVEEFSVILVDDVVKGEAKNVNLKQYNTIYYQIYHKQ